MASFTMKSAVCGTPLSQKTLVKPTLTRGVTVVRASTDEPSRRAFLSTVAGGVAWAVTYGAEAIDITDDRKVKETGYDLIYEARDLDLPQSARDGFDQFRGDIPASKARVAESFSRLKKDVPDKIEKKYWVAGREELRRQLGTLRFDLESIASTIGDKSAKKDARKAIAEFFVKVELLDDALRNKKQEEASKAYEVAMAAIGNLYLG